MCGMPKLGYLAVSTAAVLWAFGGTLARFLIDRGASIVELTEARAWITVAGIGIVVALRREGRWPSVLPPWPLVVTFGLAVAGVNLFYYVAVAELPVAVAITVQYTAPGLVVVWVMAAERRLPPRRIVWALVLALVGVAMLAGLPRVLRAGGLGLSVLGLAAAFGSAVTFAGYMLTGEKIGPMLGARRTLLAGFAVASVFWVMVQAARGRPETLLDPDFVPGVLVLAVVTTLIPFLLFLWGLERVGASRAGITSTLEPLTGAVIAFFWLGQTLDGWQLAGASMVVAGIGTIQLERPQTPEVLAERAALE